MTWHMFATRQGLGNPQRSEISPPVVVGEDAYRFFKKAFFLNYGGALGVPTQPRPSVGTGFGQWLIAPRAR